MKKVIAIISIVITVGILFACLMFIPKDNKFYLKDKHYNTEERFIEIDAEQLKDLVKNKESFAIYTYLPYCTFKIPCDVIFKTFLNNNNMSFYGVPYDELSKVDSFKEIKYAPSVILVKDGDVVTYLDANSDEDLSKYQDVDDFSNWIKKYINIK